MADKENRNPFLNVDFAVISKDAVEILGYPARMLYRSKRMKKPTTIFNANIYDSKADKIWFGDLEIERDRNALIKLAGRVGCIYILWEMEGRFLEKKPSAEYVRNHAIVIIQNGAIAYNEEFCSRMQVLTYRASQRKGR